MCVTTSSSPIRGWPASAAASSSCTEETWQRRVAAAAAAAAVVAVVAAAAAAARKCRMPAATLVYYNFHLCVSQVRTPASLGNYSY